MKATAIAHPIQGLIKYHGLKDSKLRIPFYDSISVCAEALWTTTTVEAKEPLKENLITVNDRTVVGRDLERVEAVLNTLKTIAGYKGHFKILSRNSITKGKGLFLSFWLCRSRFCCQRFFRSRYRLHVFVRNC